MNVSGCDKFWVNVVAFEPERPIAVNGDLAPGATLEYSMRERPSVGSDSPPHSPPQHSPTISPISLGSAPCNTPFRQHRALRWLLIALGVITGNTRCSPSALTLNRFTQSPSRPHLWLDASSSHHASCPLGSTPHTHLWQPASLFLPGPHHTHQTRRNSESQRERERQRETEAARANTRQHQWVIVRARASESKPFFADRAGSHPVESAQCQADCVAAVVAAAYQLTMTHVNLQRTRQEISDTAVRHMFRSASCAYLCFWHHLPLLCCCSCIFVHHASLHWYLPTLVLCTAACQHRAVLPPYTVPCTAGSQHYAAHRCLPTPCCAAPLHYALRRWLPTLCCAPLAPNTMLRTAASQHHAVLPPYTMPCAAGSLHRAVLCCCTSASLHCAC